MGSDDADDERYRAGQVWILRESVVLLLEDQTAEMRHGRTSHRVRGIDLMAADSDSAVMFGNSIAENRALHGGWFSAVMFGNSIAENRALHGGWFSRIA